MRREVTSRIPNDDYSWVRDVCEEYDLTISSLVAFAVSKLRENIVEEELISYSEKMKEEDKQRKKRYARTMIIRKR